MFCVGALDFSCCLTDESLVVWWGRTCTPSLSASIGRSAPQMVKLHHALALLAPFVFVALYHHMRFATNSLSMSNTISTRARKELSRKLKSRKAAAALLA